MTLSARVVAVACLFVAVSAFAPAPRVTGCRAVKTSSPLSMSPVELASVTEASTVLSQLPTQLVSLEVTTAAFLAVLLGTFFPCFFLITLYIQWEGFKAGNPDATEDKDKACTDDAFALDPRGEQLWRVLCALDS